MQILTLHTFVDCSQINQAARNPVDLDQLQAEAVQARMELDLRVGSIFTRVQTLELQQRVAALQESMVSYGMSAQLFLPAILVAMAS